MSKNFLPLLVFLFLISCQNVDKNKVPDNLLTEEQMVAALIDVAQLKAIKTNYSKDFDDLGISASEYLCKKHDLDSITLEESIRYYSYDPNDLKNIYQKVYDSLEKSNNKIKDFIKSRKKKDTSSSKKIDRISDKKPATSLSKKNSN